LASELTLAAYLDGRTREAVALYRNFATIASARGSDVSVWVSRTGVDFKRGRAFARASVQKRQLEIEIDLLRQIEHPALKETSVSADGVYMHRLAITSTGEMYTIVDLLQEAYDTVGPRPR